MSKEEREEQYPLKSLHDFLVEIDAEWDKFKTVSLIGIGTSVVLLILIGYRFIGLLMGMRRLGLRLFAVLDDIIFLVFVLVFVIYEIHLLYRQYKFFGRWERRMGLLIHLEERLMEGKEYSTPKESLHKREVE